MPEIVECPSCGRKLKVPDQLLGKKVRCTDCAGTFTAEAPGAAPPPPPPPPQQEEYDEPRSSRRDDREEDYDDRPSRRRGRRRSRGDYVAHRGGMVLAFGIISIVGIFVVGGAWAGVGPFAGMGNILGLVFGILGWSMGGKDMREINAGRMDPDGRGMTQAGYIMGIIGTILHVLGMLCSCIAFFGILAIIGGAAWQAKPPPGGPGPGPRPPGRFEAPPLVRFEMRPPTQLRDYLPPQAK